VDVVVAAMPFVENVPSCRELIVACCDVPPLHTCVCLPKEHAVLFRIIVDRGGLSSPPPPCVAATAMAVQLYMAVASEQNVKINFSPQHNQRSNFAIAVSPVTACKFCESLLGRQCRAGILKFKLIENSLQLFC